jgi:hypothetical protein
VRLRSITADATAASAAEATSLPPSTDPGRAAPLLLRRTPLDPAKGIAAPQAVASRALADPRSLAGLSACVDDAGGAALAQADGPPDPASFTSLRARLQSAAAALPARYRSAVAEPLLSRLDQLGARGLARVLSEDPERVGEARLLLDAAQAVLQHGEGYQPRATAAFQEVVSDLYDGFLADEARRGVKPPDRGVVPPLVRWGSGESGPYTWPVTATGSLGLGAPLVSLPAANATAGLLAWPALAHEATGHDLLAADDGLREELAQAVRAQLLAEGSAPVVAGYWAERIEETASDVLGVLNMGPAAAVGLIGYFRAMNGAWNGTPALRTQGSSEDPHPTDLARAYLAAETVRLLSFEGAGRWADRLIEEADRDLGRITLGDVAVTAGVARSSAAAVARAIVRTRLDALEGHALGEIQGWSDRDEAVVAELRQALRQGDAGSGRAGADATLARYGAGAYAAHAVAAGVYEAVSGGSSPERAQGRMVELLAAMHERNVREQAAPARRLATAASVGA